MRKSCTALGQAYALANPHPEAVAIREELSFFQAVKAPLVKLGTTTRGGSGMMPEDIDKAVQQIVDNAVAPDGIIDLFEVAGLEQPNISLLSDEFLLEVQMLPQKNVAVELLRRLIEGEIKERRRSNLVQARSFAEMLKHALDRYNDQAIAASVVINELIALAKEMQEAQERGEDLGLNNDELAFYDALSANQSAVDVMGDEQLATIARDLVTTVRRNSTIDWAVQDSARAKMRTAVKRILRKYGYPPNLQAAATRTVVQQAELFAAGAV